MLGLKSRPLGPYAHPYPQKHLDTKKEKQYSHIIKGFMYRIPFCHHLGVQASVLSTGNEKIRLTNAYWALN